MDEELADLDSLESIIVVKSTGDDCEMQEGRDHWYHELLEAATTSARPRSWTPSTVFILYSSGSTATPKGILHTTGGYLARRGGHHDVGVGPQADEDVFWSADIGWITGHSYIVYGPLL